MLTDKIPGTKALLPAIFFRGLRSVAGKNAGFINHECLEAELQYFPWHEYAFYRIPALPD
jgi:hypothetical protein